MSRQPPRSTLFPYTPLSQSPPLTGACSSRASADRSRQRRRWTVAARLVALPAASVARTRRSEEHTSELQSRQYLVCRLLLEKKNNLPPRRHINTCIKKSTRY